MSGSFSTVDVTSGTANVMSSRDFSTEHTLSAVFGITLLFCGTYLLFSLSFYEHQQLALKNNKVTNKQKKIEPPTRLLCLIAAVFALLRFILDIIEIFHSQISRDSCRWLRQVKAILYCGAITCIYLVLWLRQRHFYSLPALEYLSSRTIRFFSGSVVFIMVAANLVTIVLYVATRGYESTNRGCTVAWSTVWTKLLGLLLFLFTASFQIILVGLFIYPLYNRRKSSNLPKNEKETQQIKRVSIAAVVAVVITAIVSLLSVTALSGNYGALRQTIYSIDTFISLLCIIFSFKDWRARLFVCLATETTVVGTAKRKSKKQVTVSTNSNVGATPQCITNSVWNEELSFNFGSTAKQPGGKNQFF